MSLLVLTALVVVSIFAAWATPLLYRLVVYLSGLNSRRHAERSLRGKRISKTKLKNAAEYICSLDRSKD
jgi:hypothetical protein